MAGSKKGERRGGRKKGTLNRDTIEAGAKMRDLARTYTNAAIERLAKLLKSKNETVAAKAADSLLDRGWGRPAQSVIMMGDDQGGAVRMITGSMTAKEAAEAYAATRLGR